MDPAYSNTGVGSSKSPSKSLSRSHSPWYSMQNFHRRNNSANEKKAHANSNTLNVFLMNALGKAHETCQYITGLQAYACYVESSLTVSHSVITEDLAVELGVHADVEGSKDRALWLVNQVMEILRTEISDDKVSINDVVSKLLATCTGTRKKEAEVQQRCRHLVFLTIGLSTMLFKPGRVTSLANFRISRHDKSNKKSMSVGTDTSRRPIIAFLNGLGVVHSTPSNSITHNTESFAPSDGHTDVLTSADFSFSALKTLGKISIEWVDSMDGHLEFNEEDRVLSLFRFPSFCAAAYVGGADCLLAKVIPSKETSDRITSMPSASSARESTSMDFCRELLQSYRLLFAQDKKSRGLFWNTIRPSMKNDELYDSFLDDVCGRKISVIMARHPDLGQLLDVRGSVFQSSEFPKYAERLGTIQRYGQKHRPRRFREIWRDRRDLEKFSAFWAVIVFGSASLFLSMVQIVFNAAQLYLSYSQLHQTPT